MSRVKGLRQTRHTSDGQSLTGVGWLNKLTVTVSNAVGEVLIYDGTGTTGALIHRRTIPPAAAATGESVDIDFPDPGIAVDTGIYVDLSGGTTAVQVYYNQ